MSTLRVGIAQIDAALGSLDDNLERHLAWIDRARAEGVELLVFPELSLTGYRLLHLTSRVAVQPRTSAHVRALADASQDMAFIVGLVEEDDQGVLYNSALLLHHGDVVHVHRKLYLPTYGIFQEGRFFGAGRRLDVARMNGHSLGMLICEDMWHPHLARRLAAGGAKVLVAAAASPGRIGAGDVPENVEVWEALTRCAALVNTSWVVLANRVGWEEGSCYTGGSHIVRPGGEVAARAPLFDEHLLVETIDVRDADRLRWRLPLLRDKRNDIEGPG